MLYLTDYTVTFTGLTTDRIRSPVWSDRRTHLQPVDTFSCVGWTRKFVAVFTRPTHYLALNTTVQSTPSHQTPVYDPLFKHPLSSGIATQILLVYSYLLHTSYPHMPWHCSIYFNYFKWEIVTVLKVKRLWAFEFILYLKLSRKILQITDRWNYFLA